MLRESTVFLVLFTWQSFSSEKALLILQMLTSSDVILFTNRNTPLSGNHIESEKINF